MVCSSAFLLIGDAKEELYVERLEWWLDRSNSFRKEARYTYDFESVE